MSQPTFTDTELGLIATGVLPPGWSADLVFPALVQELRLARAATGSVEGRRVIDAAAKLMDCIAEFDPATGACSERFQELDDALVACPGTTAHYTAAYVQTVETWEKEKAAASSDVGTIEKPPLTAAVHSLLMALRPFKWCLGVSHISDDGGTLIVLLTAMAFASELPVTWYGWPVGVVVGAPPQ